MTALQGFVAVVTYRHLLWKLPLLTAILSAAIAAVLPNEYTATSQIVPPQASTSNAQLLLSQFSGVPGISSQIGGAIGLKNPGDLFAAMLRSRTIADSLIERFDLKSVYGEELLVDARKVLSERTTIVVNRSSVISIEVEDKDPVRAARLANAYVEELDRVGMSLAISEASQRRAFFETQLKEANASLASAEFALRRTQEKTGLIKLDDQGKAIIENIARLRAQLDSKRVEISALESFSTPNNPTIRRARRQLEELSTQLNRSERDTSAQMSVLVPAGKVPELGLEYIRHLRDVKYQEAVFEMLVRQLELAKLDEAKESSTAQLLDSAVVPEKKSSPRRALIVLLSTLLSMLLTVLFILMRRVLSDAVSSPESKADLLALKEAIGNHAGVR